MDLIRANPEQHFEGRTTLESLHVLMHIRDLFTVHVPLLRICPRVSVRTVSVRGAWHGHGRSRAELRGVNALASLTLKPRDEFSRRAASRVERSQTEV